MGRYSTSPHLYDECLTLSTTKLKEWGYLGTETIKSSTVSWTRGVHVSTISIRVNTISNYVLLDYSSNGEPKQYKVKLVTMKSNIGGGEIWFFLCPITKIRCRKLHLCNGIFAHRTVFKGMYSSQTESKWHRRMSKLFRSW
jgi:hypothetical protein